jgi:integrin alpha FG-GAP repeat containing protein 1
MPLGSGQVSFADFDRDGNEDILIPVCYPRPDCTIVNSIYIYFNKQKPVCTLFQKSSSCRSTTDLCTADANFRLGVFNSTPPDPYFQEVSITSGDRFYFNDEIGRPLTLRVGDYNLDGYPDVLIPVISKTGSSRVELWENVSPAPNMGRRSFAKVINSVDELTSIPNAYAGAFFDLGDDGILDMFVLADNPPRIETIFNNFEFDAFFLKTRPQWSVH